jgi:ribose-phosphate pyrophosphokinase
LKSVAALLNRLKLPEVLVVDPHSDVTPALINNCKVLTAANILEEVVESLPTYDGVIAPDGGATKRAQGVATLLGIPLYHAWKTRDVATGKLDGFGCQFLGDGRYLVVDDICDGGGTFLGLARSIKAFQQQVVLDLYVTHGYFSKGTAELKTVFDNIITTDSVIAPSSDDVHIINVWSDF